MLFQKLVNRLGVIVIDLYMRWMLSRDIRRQAPALPGAKIYAVNHPSTTDPFYLLAVTREPTSILVNKIAFGVPLFGSYMRAAGHVEVDFENGRAAFEQAARLLAQGRSIGIFPEGALSPAEGGQSDPRTGVARLALLTGAPVIPVGVHLDRSRLRSTQMTIKGSTDESRWYLNGPYAVTIGEPMVFDGDASDREYVREAAARIMSRIDALAQESARRQASYRATTWFTIRTWLFARALAPLTG